MINNLDKNYLETLTGLKEKIKTAQIKAMVAVNSELIILYWEIGKTILEQQEKQGWGANIINQLSKDLQKSFPEMKGFSPRNLGYMKKLAEIYPDFEFLQQVVAKLPWGQNIVLLDKISSNAERVYGMQKKLFKTAGQETFWFTRLKVNYMKDKECQIIKPQIS